MSHAKEIFARAILRTRALPKACCLWFVYRWDEAISVASSEDTLTEYDEDDGLGGVDRQTAYIRQSLTRENYVTFYWFVVLSEDANRSKWSNEYIYGWLLVMKWLLGHVTHHR